MIYINGMAGISPQPSSNSSDFLSEVRSYNTNMLQCIEPDYKNFLPPNALRRMGRVLKLGWATAKNCLDASEVESPDAICVGTGKGCFKNTNVFLDSVFENDEQFVPPSPFIQSAHGSIAAQIAIQTGCTQYNMTFSHRAFSFESALLDAMMLLKEDPSKNILVGAVDEIEEVQFSTFERLGHYKKPGLNNLELLNENTPGTIAGEGSHFFVIGNQPSETSYAAVKDVATFSNPKHTSEVHQQIRESLSKNELSENNLDLIIFGMNGDAELDKVYKKLQADAFPEKQQLYYKHLCGEYHTSTAFALWVASLILHHQHIPEILKLNNKPVSALKNILIYNHYQNINHSLILVQNPVK